MIKRRINRIVSSPCGNEHGSASVLAALLLYSYIGDMLWRSPRRAIKRACCRVLTGRNATRRTSPGHQSRG